MRFSAPISLKRGLWLLPAFVFIISGCAARPSVYRPSTTERMKRLARMGYTIQVGAFSQAENASRLTESLKKQGLEATYFVASKGLYKVRFGNFSSRAGALEKAEALKSSGVIEEFYIVNPGEYTAAKRDYDTPYLREEIVKTARSFLGVPYLWGGVDAETGFDCSGLTMTVYQLNGLDLPRTSLEQAEAGEAVARDRLEKGDLVFFRIKSRQKVSHVGIYAGDGNFIHAPGRGKHIRVDSLSRDYYRDRFVGGRSYF